MPKVTIEDLKTALALDDAIDRGEVFVRYSKQKPEIDALPMLRQALGDDYHVSVKAAAEALGKLGPLAADAMEDLLEAAYRIDTATGMPQSYPECLKAMVSIQPSHPGLIPLIKHFVGLDNWIPISTSLRSLQDIGTPDAIALLHRIATFWTPDLNKMQLRIVAQLLQELTTS